MVGLRTGARHRDGQRDCTTVDDADEREAGSLHPVQDAPLQYQRINGIRGGWRGVAEGAAECRRDPVVGVARQYRDHIRTHQHRLQFEGAVQGEQPCQRSPVGYGRVVKHYDRAFLGARAELIGKPLQLLRADLTVSRAWDRGIQDDDAEAANPAHILDWIFARRFAQHHLAERRACVVVADCDDELRAEALGARDELRAESPVALEFTMIGQVTRDDERVRPDTAVDRTPEDLPHVLQRVDALQSVLVGWQDVGIGHMQESSHVRNAPTRSVKRAEVHCKQLTNISLRTRPSGDDRVFGTATVVTISGVTIQNGYLGTELGDRTSGGLSNGAIDRLGGTMTVIDSVIRNNAGTYGGVENHGTMTLLNSSVTGNAGRFSGGGVWNEGTMTVTNSSINSNGNSAGVGGGVVNRSRLTITNSTISGNHASSGGGIYNQGSLIVHSSTFSDNVGGALVGDATLDNTILANSRPFELGPQPDCSGMLTSNGYNLIGLATGCTLVGNTTGDVLGTDPKLGPLQNNGGPTFTHALLPGSPAIDAGNPTAPGKSPSACLATDQRGVARPQDGNLDGRAVCDIGAFEVQPPVTFASLCTLSRQLVTNAALSNGMCSTLQAAERSKARGLPGVKAKLLSTYADLVDTAQRIGTVTTERAARLKSLAATL
jgi:hypothetical protein